jgi:hypothetical protein
MRTENGENVSSNHHWKQGVFLREGIQKAVRKQAKAKQKNHSGLVKKCRTGHPDVIQVSHDSSKADD